MLRKWIRVPLAILALLLPAASASAQQGGGGDAAIQLLLQSMVIAVEIPLPTWNDGPEEWGGKAPQLSFLRRDATPELGDIYGRFFKEEKKAIGSEAITAPAYGKGTRYKGPRMSVTKRGTERVGISFYVDVYDWGFEYVNNLTEKPTNSMRKESTPDNPQYDYAFSESDGIAAAKKYIDELTPGLGAPGKGFAIHEEAWFEYEKGRLFVYRITKTHYGIPLVDDYVQVAIDGDKNLANISYFWAKGLSKYGDTYTAIDAGRALQSAKLIALDDFKNEPPPLTLFGVKLGFVNYRKDPGVLLPAWLFNLRWNETWGYEKPDWDSTKAEQRYLSEVITHDYLLGVDAFFATKVELVL